ncbi:uncharacterized protein EI97DRAFT_372414 [Westerdykella ornata]|uniref:Uncharacterized protein n=1 Tax=Westerdykella ornata TaxID=318751 RepID=A0A6A6JT73_WESOR|nr:uncharacterized protein EI97DRAFT_372414 [Westerdykella ornata]KAF2278946.1 hypothetical protein EI97DRAFT_372414 [Westerdykella ornata]
MASTSYATETSPFEIPHEELQVLCQSHGFQVLRTWLDNRYSFCPRHSTCDIKTQETWTLHRDILHALIMPIVALYKRASALAEAALCTTKSEDLELAFAGDARGAFLWLQCFLAEEADWCQTRGCPACVTAETMSTESHIRLTIAASLLSTTQLYAENSSPVIGDFGGDAPSPPAAGPDLTLPPLPQILPALHDALDKDPFWGPEYWTYLFERANQLSSAIEALITSCGDLESLVASPTTAKPAPHRSVTMPGLIYTRLDSGARGAKLKKSRLASRQLRMKGEEMEIMRRCALQCWAKAAVPSKFRNELLGRIERRRSLTCP